MYKRIHIFLILLSSLFPVYGLFFLGWSPYATVLVFWAETVIMFLFFAAQMIVRIFMRQWVAIAVLFIASQATPFIFIHLFLSTLIFGTNVSELGWHEMIYLITLGLSSVIYGIFIVLIKYISEFFIFIKNREYTKPLSTRKMEAVSVLFSRIFTMQFTIIFGGAVARLFDNVNLGVSVLVISQTIFNLYSYFKNSKHV